MIVEFHWVDLNTTSKDVEFHWVILDLDTRKPYCFSVLEIEGQLFCTCLAKMYTDDNNILRFVLQDTPLRFTVQFMNLTTFIQCFMRSN